jgi:hypothetical protein
MRRDGSQKVTKKGKPVVLRVTTSDKSQPLPNQKCGKCGKEIFVGSPYKWIKPKSGPYGGRLMVRCSTCPSWNVWEYSSSLSARIAQISHNAWAAFPDDASSTDEIQSWLDETADEVQSLSEEKAESAQNIEDGFGHETSTSAELTEVAESLEGWAEEIRGTDIPELPDPEDVDCEECDGSGEVIDTDSEEEAETTKDTPMVPCDECHGNGTITPEDLSDEEMSEWLEEVKEACGIVEESPV